MSLLNSSGINIRFFCFLLNKFYYPCSPIFATAQYLASLNSSPAFNPQMRGIVGKSWILTKSEIVFLHAFFESRKRCKYQTMQYEKTSNCDVMNRESSFLSNIPLEYLHMSLSFKSTFDRRNFRCEIFANFPNLGQICKNESPETFKSLHS